MQVLDRQNQDVAILDGVDQPARKPAEAAAPNSLAQRMPRLGKASDTLGGRQHLDQKRVTQAGCLCAVPLDGLVEFSFGNIEKPETSSTFDISSDHVRMNSVSIRSTHAKA